MRPVRPVRPAEGLRGAGGMEQYRRVHAYASLTSDLASGSMACGAAAATMAKNRAMPMASIFFFFSARPKCAGAFKTPSTCSGEIECLHDGHDFYRHDLDQAARADEETAAKNCARCYFPRADPKKVQNEESFPRNEISVFQKDVFFSFFPTRGARRA